MGISLSTAVATMVWRWQGYIVSLKGVINLLKLYRQVIEYKVYELGVTIKKNYINKGRPTLSQRAPFLGLLPMSEFGRILVF